MLLLGQFLTSRGAYREAEALLSEALPVRQAMFGPGHRLTLRGLQALVTLYEAWDRPQQLATYRRLLDEARRAQDEAGREPARR